MLAIVASEQDRAAAALVARWADQPARLLSPRDLSRPGWRHHVGGDGGTLAEGWAVIGGERVRTDDVRGVITRLPLVQERDLPHIVPADREYVAAEMTAFLLAWLSALRCPVLNRPTVTSLMGRNLGLERWLAIAARAGVRIARARPAIDGERSPVVTAVTVIGDDAIGDVAPALAEAAVRLAARAEVALCTVRFDGPGADAAFVDADLLVDVDDPRIADALLAHLADGGDA